MFNLSKNPQRYILLVWIIIALTLLDFLVSCHSDQFCLEGRSYKSTYSPEPMQWGLNRIAYNFRHFISFWEKPSPDRELYSLKDLFESDSNSVFQNLTHFFLFLIFSVAGTCLGFGALVIFLAGTVFNIIHEYIVEGCYVDPSFIDLWLGQLGIHFGLLIYLAARNKNLCRYP